MNIKKELKLSDEEFEDFKRVAEERGMSLAEAMRQSALEFCMLIEEPKEAVPVEPSKAVPVSQQTVVSQAKAVPVLKTGLSTETLNRYQKMMTVSAVPPVEDSIVLEEYEPTIPKQFVAPIIPASDPKRDIVSSKSMLAKRKKTR